MRANLAAYLEKRPSLLALSYTLTTRRLHHPFRITFAASSHEEAQERLQYASVEELREQSMKVQPALIFTGKVAQASVAELSQGDAVFSKTFSTCAAMLAAAGLGRISHESDKREAIEGIRAEIALLVMFQSWNVSPSKVAARGHGIIPALVAAKSMSLQEALLLACLIGRDATVKKTLAKLAVRVPTIEIVLASGTIPAGAPLSSHLNLIMEELCSDTVSVVPEPSFKSDVNFATLQLSEHAWRSVAEFCARLHASAWPIQWTDVFASFFPGLLYLHDLPPYPFALTRHWIEYTDRNLIRPALDSPDSVAIQSFNDEDGSPAPCLPPPSFPMLGELVTLHADAYASDLVDVENLAIYESSIIAQPMMHFIMGHLVNSLPLAPATLYAELCMEAALDIWTRISTEDSKEYRPELGELEIIRPLTVAKVDQEKRHLVIAVKGRFFDKTFNITISSRAGQEDQVQHMAAQVQLVFADEAWSLWTKLSPLVGNQFHRVRTAPDADIISARLAYSAFETVVVYTEASGFRGIQSMALLEDTCEAASIVQMSTDAPRSQYVVNPCHIDSLGQITGFICNSLSDSKAVYIADGVKAMRFSSALANAAQTSSSFHVYCKMHPQDGGASYLGDAYFMDSSNVIIGEMEGVRYKRVPRAVLDMLLPGPQRAPGKPQPGQATLVKQSAQPSSARALKPSVASQGRAQMIFKTIMETISIELGMDATELTSDKAFADLGLDSLMQLVILGSLTNLAIGVSLLFHASLKLLLQRD